VLDMEAEQVLHKADVARYKAKELGRNRVEEF
jgi:GGDEF domain-containing protein